ncbi:NAD(P)-dependent dehydrogenase (short-subunit alcohol dehydrogenase family) [Rhizobium sp. BK313]|uniref:hypothetical protein n=1 Tax=Rhizobium sp. BK313 TaxID=2587081 RepID=UPI0017DD744D|nr:NAD(P)-dependent dehydrogenase (short-subunit alcohol dehydrogenase family) [Rhizobium sp. BK313]
MATPDIAVNCVTSAVARTPGAVEQTPQHIAYMLSRIPRGRFLELNEAAAMIAWLVARKILSPRVRCSISQVDVRLIEPGNWINVPTT